MPPAGRAAVRGGVIGNYVDQINIFLPVTALAPAMSTLAGPEAAATTTAYVVMATLIGRPLGATVFGRIADAVGRTRTTRIAISGTAACTLAIAAIPTYRSIGSWSIALVLGLRFLGGMFLAGEYSAAIPLAMEWSRPSRRGLVSGLIMSMAPWAQATIAFVTAGLLATLGLDAYAAWGWRVSFAAGASASVCMLFYYRRHVVDSPAFHRNRRDETRPGARLTDLLIGCYRGGFWQMFGLMSGLWFMTNMVVVVLTSRLGRDTGLSATSVSLVMGIASVGQATVMALTGHLSSKLGRRRFFIGWGLHAAVAGPALWAWTLAQQNVGAIAAGALLVQVVTVCGYGPVGAYLCERFPTSIRATGYGTAYSLSIVIPAMYPYYLPTMERLLGHSGAVLALLGLGGLLVAGCGAAGPRLSARDIDDDVETVASRTWMRRG